jgi:hypothetical protein
VITTRLTADRWAQQFTERRMADHNDPERERGLGTLEMVIITLGLMAVAGLLVAAITTSVTSRTSKIK